MANPFDTLSPPEAQEAVDAEREDVAAAVTDDLRSLPASMTIPQVADLLNVSRPYVVKLASSGELPHTMVGSHHRFHRKDVLEYCERMRSTREAALRRLVPEGGYTPEDF